MSKRGYFRLHETKVLFSYRITLQCTTGISPVELLLGWRLDLLRLNTPEIAEDKPQHQSEITAKSRTFNEDDAVLVILRKWSSMNIKKNSRVIQSSLI